MEAKKGVPATITFVVRKLGDSEKVVVGWNDGFFIIQPRLRREKKLCR